MPAISVIVPVYRVEAYLPKCIDSILAQSFQDFELILVDDGSPDGCGEICDKYAASDERIIVLHQMNAGVSAARNNGLAHARGQYIAFCDSDDYLETTHLDILVHALEDNDVDSAVISFKIVDEAGAVIRNVHHSEGVFRFLSQDDRIKYIFQGLFAKRLGWEIWSRLFCKRIIDEHRIRFCESCGNFAEDLGFVLSYAFFSGGEASVNQCSYCYLQRSGSMMDASKQVIKLNQVNEVSKSVYLQYSEECSCKMNVRSFSMFHIAILYNQLFKLLISDQHAIDAAFHSVSDPVWMRRNLRGVLSHRKAFIKYFGRRDAWRMILLAHYARHQNAFLFRLERSVINRFVVGVD